MLLHNIKSIATVGFVALCMLFSVSSAQADENKIPAELNSPFAQGEPNTAYAKYFIGNSYLNRLSSEGVSIANVTFEPRCRNNWHIHHAAQGGGQILLCTAGRGWYQEWGKEARALKTGDVVIIPAGVKHWHGAPVRIIQKTALRKHRLSRAVTPRVPSLPGKCGSKSSQTLTDIS